MVNFSFTLFLTTIKAYEGSTEIIFEKKNGSSRNSGDPGPLSNSAREGWQRIEISRGTQNEMVTEKTKLSFYISFLSVNFKKINFRHKAFFEIWLQQEMVNYLLTKYDKTQRAQINEQLTLTVNFYVQV